MAVGCSAQEPQRTALGGLGGGRRGRRGEGSSYPHQSGLETPQRAVTKVLVVEIQRKIPEARGLRRCWPEFGF